MKETIKPLIIEIQKYFKTFAPQNIDGDFKIAELKDIDNFEFSAKQPLFSFKKFLIPECEEIIKYQRNKEVSEYKNNKIAVLGAGLQDLKYILLYDLAFKNDPIYQARRKNILVIAHNLVPGPEKNFARMEFQEDSLKSFPYDIFTILKGEEAEFVAGSKAGKNILEKISLPFRDLSWREIVIPKKMPEIPAKIQAKLFAEENLSVWDKLNDRCIRCGKCSVVCPTCFCFRIDDKPDLKKGEGSRQRCWDSCFFDEFHEVAGGHDFKPEIKNRIHFWYYHKFARIPKEFNMTGCVGCKRCHTVCPADIDIQKVLDSIINN